MGSTDNGKVPRFFAPMSKWLANLIEASLPSRGDIRIVGYSYTPGEKRYTEEQKEGYKVSESRKFGLDHRK